MNDVASRLRPNDLTAAIWTHIAHLDAEIAHHREQARDIAVWSTDPEALGRCIAAWLTDPDALGRSLGEVIAETRREIVGRASRSAGSLLSARRRFIDAVEGR